MLANPEDIEAELVGVLDLLDQFTKALRRRHRTTRFGVGRGETVNSDFHELPPDLGSPRRRGRRYILISNYMIIRYTSSNDGRLGRTPLAQTRDESHRQAGHPYVAGAHESASHAEAPCGTQHSSARHVPV